MKTKKELFRTKEYWIEQIQNEIYTRVVEFMNEKNMNQIEFANHLGVSKGYVTQILKGECNFSLKKWIELSLAIEKIPSLQFIKPKQELKEKKVDLQTEKKKKTKIKYIYPTSDSVQLVKEGKLKYKAKSKK